MNAKNDKLIRSKDVKKRLGGISNTTLWRRIKDGTIPKPIKLGGGHANFFKESWINEIVDVSISEE